MAPASRNVSFPEIATTFPGGFGVGSRATAGPACAPASRTESERSYDADLAEVEVEGLEIQRAASSAVAAAQQRLKELGVVGKAQGPGQKTAV